MRALPITLWMLEKKLQNLFNGINPPGYVGNMKNSESSAGSEENGSFWPGLATDSRTMDVIGKIFLETTSMCLIKTLCFTEWLLKLTHP